MASRSLLSRDGGRCEAELAMWHGGRRSSSSPTNRQRRRPSHRSETERSTHRPTGRPASHSVHDTRVYIGDVTSQSLWSRDDRYFVGITRYNALRYMAKIDHVIRIKLNQFKKMDIWSLTYQQSACKRYHSDKHFSDFYLQDGGINQLA